MYHPSRGGVRGGRDQFNWEDVKGDKHRENYIGHSLKAPVGRWQKGKDLFWYTKDTSGALASDIAKEEIERIKLEEEQAMREALGLAPKRSARPFGSQLDKREVAELLKKGSTAEDLDDTYAVGERVQGLGYAPVLGQRGNKKIHVSANAEHENTLFQLDNLAGVGNAIEGSLPATAASEKPSVAEGAKDSIQMKKKEKRAAREAKRQERREKKLAKKEAKAGHRKERDQHKNRLKQEGPGIEDLVARETTSAAHKRSYHDLSSSRSSDEAKKRFDTPRNRQVLSHAGVSVKISEEQKQQSGHDSDSSSYTSDEEKEVKNSLRKKEAHSANDLENYSPLKQRRRHHSDPSAYNSDEAKEVRKRHRNVCNLSHAAVSGKISERHSPVKLKRRHDLDSSCYSSDEAKEMIKNLGNGNISSLTTMCGKMSEKQSSLKRHGRYDSDSASYSGNEAKEVKNSLKKGQGSSYAAVSGKASQMHSSLRGRRRHDSDSSSYGSEEAKEVSNTLSKAQKKASEKDSSLIGQKRHHSYSSIYLGDEVKEARNTLKNDEFFSRRASETHSTLKQRRRHDSESEDGYVRTVNSDRYRRK